LLRVAHRVEEKSSFGTVVAIVTGHVRGCISLVFPRAGLNGTVLVNISKDAPRRVRAADAPRAKSEMHGDLRPTPLASWLPIRSAAQSPCSPDIRGLLEAARRRADATSIERVDRVGSVRGPPLKPIWYASFLRRHSSPDLP